MVETKLKGDLWRGLTLVADGGTASLRDARNKVELPLGTSALNSVHLIATAWKRAALLLRDEGLKLEGESPNTFTLPGTTITIMVDSAARVVVHLRGEASGNSLVLIGGVYPSRALGWKYTLKSLENLSTALWDLARHGEPDASK